jgi:hypothetical protein
MKQVVAAEQIKSLGGNVASNLSNLKECWIHELIKRMLSILRLLFNLQMNLQVTGEIQPSISQTGHDTEIHKKHENEGMGLWITDRRSLPHFIYAR